MGARGPKKKLPAIKRLEGNPGKYPIEDSGVEALGQPFTPECLSEIGRGCLEVIRLSMPVEVYSALDTFLLTAFAQTWANIYRAQLELSRPDFQPVNDENQESRWMAIHRKEVANLCALGDRLGLDPKARAALKLPKANQQPQEFDGLIGRPVSSSSLKHSEYQAE
jgi:phage terminase small subunit